MMAKKSVCTAGSRYAPRSFDDIFCGQRPASAWLIVLAGALTACGGGGGGDSPAPPTPPAPPPPATYTITATVDGLTGTGLVLANNNGSPIPVSANGAVTIAAVAASGASYSVSIQTQPTASPRQACRVVSGRGTVGTNNVANIAIECRPLLGKFVYAVSRGSLLDIGPLEITGYRVDAAAGGLTVLPGFPVTPPAPVFVGSPFGDVLELLSVLPTPDERYMLAARSNLGIDPMGGAGTATDTGGILTSYRVDAETGALTEVSSLAGPLGMRPAYSVTMDPNGRYLAILSAPVNRGGAYIADPVLSIVELNPSTGALSMVPGSSSIALPSYASGQFGPGPLAQAVGAPTFNPNDSAVYSLLTFGRRSIVLATFSQGALGVAPYIAAGWQPVQAPEPGVATSTQFLANTGLALSPDGRRLTATGGYFSTDINSVNLGNITSSTASVAVMNLDPVTGGVTSRTAPDLACSDCWLTGVTFSADGQTLLASNPGYYPGKPRPQETPGNNFSGPASLSTFSLDSSGVPSLDNGAPFALGQNGAQLFRLHPFGPRAYFAVAATGAGGGVAAIQRGTGGAWASLGTMAAPGLSASVMDLQIDGSGRYLYASDLGQDQLHAFRIDQTTGQLTLVNSVPTQVDPAQVIVIGSQMAP